MHYHVLEEPLGFIFSKNVCIFSCRIFGQKYVPPLTILLAPNDSTLCSSCSSGSTLGYGLAAITDY